MNTTKFPFLSNYLIFDQQFITYIVILYNYNSFTEIKKIRWNWPLTPMTRPKTCKYV